MSNYQIIDAKNRKKLREILSSKGQALLPFLDAIERTEIAIDEVIDVAGRATIEAVLDLSAQSVAGEKHPGKKGSDVRWHGRQGGVVSLAERKLRVSRPRLRRKGKAGGGEVAIPAYEAVNNSSRLSQRIWEILMLGVSTRKYASVLPEMAETVGVSKSEVSREFVEASAEQLQGLMERPLDELEIAVVYLDGIRFGEHHALAAIGVDTEGYKHVLGLRDGASENQIVCKALLEDLVERGLSPERCRLFVIDGSKALRVAVDAVFGTHNKVQRCKEAQGAQCARLSTAGAEAASASEPAFGLAAPSKEGQSAVGATGEVARGRLPLGGGEHPGGARRDVHHQRARPPRISETLPWIDEHHRVVLQRCARSYPSRHPLAQWQDGSEMGPSCPKIQPNSRSDPK